MVAVNIFIEKCTESKSAFSVLSTILPLPHDCSNILCFSMLHGDAHVSKSG